MADPRRQRRGSALQAAALVAGGAGLFLVVVDGSPFWQAVRAVVVVALTTAVLVALRSAPAGGRSLVAYLAGAVAVTAGLGIGVGHAAKGVLDAGTVAGLLCLGAGAVLLVGGVVGLSRTVRRRQRPLVALLASVVALLVVFPAWPAVYATNVPRPAAPSATPVDHGLDYRDVDVRTPDGVRLAAWYVPARNRAAVVLRHGAGSTRAAVLPHAAVLAAHGYGVLMLDARGHGASAGDAMDFGWWGDQDVAGALDVLAAQADVDDSRLGVVGISMGGEEAVGAAGGDSRIRAVVAEGATGRTAADLGWLSEAYGARGTVTQAWRGVITFPLADLLTSAPQPTALRAAVGEAGPTPVLLITAGSVEDEAAAAEHIRSGSPATVRIWTVPDAEHTGGLATDPQGWASKVTRFLDEALRPEG